MKDHAIRPIPEMIESMSLDLTHYSPATAPSKKSLGKSVALQGAMKVTTSSTELFQASQVVNGGGHGVSNAAGEAGASLGGQASEEFKSPVSSGNSKKKHSSIVQNFRSRWYRSNNGLAVYVSEAGQY